MDLNKETKMAPRNHNDLPRINIEEKKARAWLVHQYLREHGYDNVFQYTVKNATTIDKLQAAVDEWIEVQ